MAFGAGMSDVPLLTWPDLTERLRPEPDATVAYGPATMQRVDVWRPAGSGPHPVVLMVHGGCWQTSIADRKLMNWLAADLRAGGVAVWNVDYRGVDRAGGGYPGTFEDAARAAGLPGRLIPLPTGIAASCGLAWKLPAGVDADAQDGLPQLRREGVYRHESGTYHRLDA